MRNVGHQRKTRSARSDRQYGGRRRASNASDDRADREAFLETASFAERRDLASNCEHLNEVRIAGAVDDSHYKVV